MENELPKAWRWAGGLQAAYYVVTGALPLISMTAFEAITGEKVDDWLVQTVGLLVLVVAAAIVMSLRRREIPPETLLLAVGCGVVLSGVDVTFVALGRISPVYLADAAIHAVLITLWGVGWRQRARYTASHAK